MGGKVVGYRKQVKQIAYYELLNAGHFSYNEQPAVIVNILKESVIPTASITSRLRGSNEHIGHRHHDTAG